MRTIGNTPVGGELRAVASGALPNGKPVVVNADGTVSAAASTDASTGTAVSAGFSGGGGLTVSAMSSTKFAGVAQSDSGNNNYGTAIVGTVSGSSISFGTKADIGVAYPEKAQCVGLSDTKFVFIFKDGNDANKGKAVVGTVSGTSISFGSAVVFELGQTGLNEVNAATRLTDTTFVIAFEDASDSGKAKAIVGTVSGASVSFGAAATFATPNSSMVATVSALSATKVVIAWSSTPDTEAGKVIIGTVSGTSISYGSAITFDSSRIVRLSAAALSDSKFAIAYEDDRLGSQYGTAIAGTVSGTTITLGTPVVFHSAALENKTPAITKMDADNFAVAFRDALNSNYGAVIQGVVSGTSISFETKVIFSSAASTENWTTLVSDKVVIGYNQAALTATTYSGASTNLTSENYIGIAKGAAADGTSAVVQTGCSINDAQSGLTAGQAYYVQTDGTLGLTADDPSVLAGTAVSATKLIVKG